MDWNDSNKLAEQAKLVVGLAEKYRKARNECAQAKLFLDLRLALKYKDKSIGRKIALEKAYIDLIQEVIGTDEEATFVEAYRVFVQQEADYKGLEKMLEANQGVLILHQSLMKNQARNT
jgi:hypothetical protein